MPLVIKGITLALRSDASCQDADSCDIVVTYGPGTSAAQIGKYRAVTGRVITSDPGLRKNNGGKEAEVQVEQHLALVRTTICRSASAERSTRYPIVLTIAFLHLSMQRYATSPVVTLYDGPAALDLTTGKYNAYTTGGEDLIINGLNFGPLGQSQIR